MQTSKHYEYSISIFLGAGDVWFSFRNVTYQNNSNVTLEDLGENDTALLCVTNLTACCQLPGSNGSTIGKWFFPNGTEVSSSSAMWSFYITSGDMMVLLHHTKGGVEGIYRCEIHSMKVNQTIYIGVYTASAGE